VWSAIPCWKTGIICLVSLCGGKGGTSRKNLWVCEGDGGVEGLPEGADAPPKTQRQGLGLPPKRPRPNTNKLAKGNRCRHLTLLNETEWSVEFMVAEGVEWENIVDHEHPH